MPKLGLFLVNTKQWGVHDPNSLLAPLTGVHMWLNDDIISKAKALALELEMSEFAIVRATLKQARVQLYFHLFE